MSKSYRILRVIIGIMKRILIVTIVVLLLALAGYLLFKTKPSTKNGLDQINQQSNVEPKNTDEKNSITSEQPNKIIVTYGAGGFSPATITIKKGQEVVFKNESGKQMWVASDDHPSHLIYPEFDTKKGLVNGSSYEFTFDKLGTWHYHDHLTSSRTGIVIVE